MTVTSKKAIHLMLTLLLVTTAYAQTKKQLPEAVISKQEAEKQLRYLAADELMGRKTGTPGNDAAAAFIAKEFKRLGLAPAPGTQNYFQQVTLQLSSSPASKSTFIVDDMVVSGSNLVVLGKGAVNQKAPLVFVNFGLQDAATGTDDYKDLDVKGKIVVARAGVPNTKSPSDLFRASREKRKLAAEKGAIALVELYNHPFPWQQIAGYFSRPSYTVQQSTKQAQTEIAHLMINKPALEQEILEKAQDASTTASVHVPTTDAQTVVSQNVAAVIKGKDKTLSKEWIILSAHYDHVGTGMTAGAGATPEDTIFNGARDNAMGTVALLSAAKALAKNPPARSVLLIALTGEELGMLGSSYYVENPLVPLHQTVFTLNTDGAGYNDTTLVTINGLNRTSAENLIKQAAADFGLEAVSDPVPEQNLFDRSDNVKFAEKGIPAPNFAPGFTGFDNELMKYYHNAQDEAEYINYDYLLKYVKAFARSARLIANSPQAPQWVPGDKYEAAGKALYGAR
jgi:hypothetical protein